MKTFINGNNRKLLLGGLFCLALGGLVYSQAMQPYIRFEAEQGAVFGQAAAASDSLASNGSYLGFTSNASPGGLPFAVDFDNSADFYNNFQTEVLHGALPAEIQAWAGDHNTSCAGPTTTRTLSVTNEADSFYWCGANGADSGHVHTSMRSSGFALVSFAPNQAFNNIHKICWDQTMTDLGGRRFHQVTVVPETTYQANNQRLGYVSGNNAIGTGAGIFIAGDTFMLEFFRGSTNTFVGQSVSDVDFGGFTSGSDKLRRFKNCMTDNENGTISFSLERQSSTDTRTLQGSFPNGPARVIFQDHSYNPPKDAPATPDPNTTHWDNISIE